MEDTLEALVGRMVLNDLWVQNELVALRSTLHECGLPAKLVDMKYGVALQHVLSVLKNPMVPKGYREVATSAVEYAKMQHGRRNDVAHELIVKVRNDDTRYRSMFDYENTRPLEELRVAAEDLMTGLWRLRGARIIGPYWLGGERDSWDQADDLRSWSRVAMGHIADIPNYVRGTPGDAPEPDGGWEAIIATLVAERDANDSRLGMYFEA